MTTVGQVLRRPALRVRPNRAAVAWRGGETPMAPVPKAGELPELPLDRVPIERYVRSTVLGPTLQHLAVV